MPTDIKREGLKRSKFYAKKKEALAAAPKYEARAVAKFVRISPRKARAVVNSIRGKNVSEAFNLLEFSSKKAARIINGVLKSAVANATNNLGLSEDNLYVSSCYVSDGPRMKRVWPRGRGRADIIQKRMSHITVVVTDREKEKEYSEK
ncbi:MAG TPA: 50S ribosomal protein L22 [Fervidobacterium sp.]|nr:50S ribosomal protein L22 [Fervidobacterium sp.]HOQ38972.1 50S ribosomal protein L22 [Fervidobacterium sp.]HPP17874.1 50S ribosomal protein L22 [Fervidobacterium sp.]HPT54983.1 50S ribosomal protein L22 [Fervidobacterium sp.]HPZ16802.1 50S ribosomal protein L22 [Fervidobacterium sp.]